MRTRTSPFIAIVRLSIIVTLPQQAICIPKIIRNNPLLNDMVSQFMNKLPEFKTTPTATANSVPMTNIMDRMKEVLCSNFKNVPCDLIAQDKTLRQLLEKSVQQITTNALAYENTTDSTSPPPSNELKSLESGKQRSNYINSHSEDLSNFLDLGDINLSQHHYDRDNVPSKKKRQDDDKIINSNSVRRFQAVRKTSDLVTRKQKVLFPEYTKRDRKLYTKSGKKLKRYYPHKIKTKDKPHKQFLTTAFDATINSDDKLSKSEEVPFKNVLVYKLDDLPSWKIDYAKHGPRTRSVLDKELKSKLTRTNPNAIDDEFFENFEKKSVVRSPNLRIGTDLLNKMNHVIRYDSH